MAYTLDRKLWLTADKERVVEDGDPEAAFLLGTPGKKVSDEDAERLGLTKATKKKAEKEEPSEAVVALTEAISGLTQNAAEALVGAGFESVEQLREVDDQTLDEIAGVGETSIARIREVAPVAADGQDSDE